MQNFDVSIERRGTHAMKWDGFAPIYNLENTDGILPMWVADMDLAAPDCVIDAITNRLKHPVFGYTAVNEATYQAVQNWLQSHHNFTVAQEEILFRHGVIPALANAIAALTDEGDTVLISTPVYHPFYFIPTNLNRKLATCPLYEQDGVYTFDFATFEEALKTADAYILCNPHNPGGMVWSKEDLTEIVRLCQKHNVLILSDEIHADLVFEGHSHIPIATIEGAEDVVTFMAPTKTFNLASIQSAFMIVKNAEQREKIATYYAATGQGSINVLAIEATRAAFEQGEAWRKELLSYIEGNMDIVCAALNELEGIQAHKPQGTYLLWIDYRQTGLSEEVMMARLLQDAKLALEPGTKYGEEGRGFLRMNLACSRDTAQEAIKRFTKIMA